MNVLFPRVLGIELVMQRPLKDTSAAGISPEHNETQLEVSESDPSMTQAYLRNLCASGGIS